MRMQGMRAPMRKANVPPPRKDQSSGSIRAHMRMHVRFTGGLCSASHPLSASCAFLGEFSCARRCIDYASIHKYGIDVTD